MVGALMLAKILHCRPKEKNKRRKNDIKREKSSHTSKSNSNLIVKTENREEHICRICLKEGMIPIIGSEFNEDFVDSVYIFGAIKVQIDDPYPKYLCQPCHALLEGAILFRKTAQQSEETLRKEYTTKRVKCDENVYNEQQHNYLENEYDENISTEEQPPENSSKSLKCRRCDLVFDNLDEYTEHRISLLHENKKITCDICKKSYKPDYYKKHRLTHAKNCLYICDICGKNFTIQGHFTRHRLTHSYELPFKCSLCPYRGRFTESLKMHMRSHTGEKPYQCTACPSRFISKSNLNKHMLTHKTGYDFRCEVCGRGFNAKRDVELHIKADHNGIKEHKCRICGKAFGYRKQMTKHEVKVHKREKMRSGRMPIYLQVENMKENGNV